MIKKRKNKSKDVSINILDPSNFDISQLKLPKYTIPKEYATLENYLEKLVFDGLGPIIGYRKDWTGKKEHAGARDSSIIEVHAKKVKTEGREFVEIEIEQLYEAVRK